MRKKALVLLMVCLLLAGCAAKAAPLATPRLEAVGLSFQLPEGWTHEAYRWHEPSNEQETVVSVFPSDEEPVTWVMGTFLWNVSLYAAGEGAVGLRGSHNFEEGMTVDEWAEARRAWQEKMENQPLQDYTVEEISEDTRKVQYTPVGEGMPDTILIYLRVIDGHAFWLADGRPIQGGTTKEDMALFEQIILSVEIPAPRVEAVGLSFRLPEGWEYEAVKWQPDDETESIVCLYPPGVEHRGYPLSLYLWNLSLYNAMSRGNTRAITDFEDGMTVDEWIAAREAQRVADRLEEIPEYKVEKVADDIRRVSNAEGEGLAYDTVAYLRVVDGQGMWMVESYLREDYSEEHEALKEQIIRSVEVLP